MYYPLLFAKAHQTFERIAYGYNIVIRGVYGWGLGIALDPKLKGAGSEIDSQVF
jgi:hypothetical protein